MGLQRVAGRMWYLDGFSPQLTASQNWDSGPSSLAQETGQRLQEWRGQET